MAGDVTPVRTFALSALGSGLSVVLYVVFVGKVGVGGRSDAFFAPLALVQTVNAILFAPYDQFALRHALKGMASGRQAIWALAGSYFLLSVAAVAVYLAVGVSVLPRAFEPLARPEAVLWRFHVLILTPLIPLAGILLLLQTHCQARGDYDRPKIALIVGRGVSVLVLLGSGPSSDRTIGVAVVSAHAIAIALSAGGMGRMTGWTALRRDVVAVLREWLHVNTWGVVLKSEILLDRILASHVRPGFLSLFNLAWSGMLGVVEAFQGSFVAIDTNQYFLTHGSRRAPLRLQQLLSAYRRSLNAALALAALLGVSALGVVVIATTGMIDVVIEAVTLGELALLLTSVVAVSFLFAVWKQLSGIYTIQGRAVEFVKVLVLVFAVISPLRVVLGVYAGSAGFCIGLLMYYGGQTGALLGRLALVPESVSHSTGGGSGGG